jgi:hypothetical protein
VEIFGKDFSDLHDSKREEKLLSSSDFVTAASVVQQSANSNPLAMNLGWCSDDPRLSSHSASLPDCPGSFILLIRPIAIIAPTN